LLFACIFFAQSQFKLSLKFFPVGSVAMQISASSAFNSGLSSVQNGQQRVNQAATDIASASASLPKPVAESAAPNPSNSQAQQVDLASSLVDLQIGKEQVQAGAKVIKTADDTLGTLLDIRA
jgi:flagellar hook protein FlgE